MQSRPTRESEPLPPAPQPRDLREDFSPPRPESPLPTAGSPEASSRAKSARFPILAPAIQPTPNSDRESSSAARYRIATPAVPKHAWRRAATGPEINLQPQAFASAAPRP